MTLPSILASAPVVLLALTTLTGAYALLCAANPFRRCRACAGTGTRRSPLVLARPCLRCRATGRRIRIGRHLYNYLRRVYQEGTR